MVPTPSEFTLHVRIPGWTKSPPQIFLNDRPLDVPAGCGTFCAIRRRWKNHDTLQVKFPLDLRTEAIDDQHPKTVAVMRGPVMLVAVDAPQGLLERPLALPDGLKPVPHNPQAFELDQAGEKLRLEPYYSVGDETYTNYLVRT
jgi:DUF1680 family protein